MIANADKVISKQGELIKLQTDRISELRDENQRLSEALVSLKKVSDTSLETNLLYGAGGLALGALLMGLARK